MKVHFYGTRGSVSVCRRSSMRYGGNTTCLRIESQCLPPDHWLVVDGGTGFFQLGLDALQAGVKKMTILATHWHHDHTMGFFLCPQLYSDGVPIEVYGPLQDGVGPKQMFQHLMKEPFFPVNYTKVASHLHCKGVQNPSNMKLVIHPRGGTKLIPMEEYKRALLQSPSQIKISGTSYDLEDCLVVGMLDSNHPERTISYRFQEVGGSSFGFLTDHENMDQNPVWLIDHVKSVHLLVMDCQYSRTMYNNRTRGFGHGTPDYCAGTAFEANAWRLGLTHHDPAATDEDIDMRLAEAKQEADNLNYRGEIFACADFQTVEL